MSGKDGSSPTSKGTPAFVELPHVRPSTAVPLTPDHQRVPTGVCIAACTVDGQQMVLGQASLKVPLMEAVAPLLFAIAMKDAGASDVAEVRTCRCRCYRGLLCCCRGLPLPTVVVSRSTLCLRIQSRARYVRSQGRGDHVPRLVKRSSNATGPCSFALSACSGSVVSPLPRSRIRLH